MPEEIINITIEDSNEAVNITVDETTEQVNITIGETQPVKTSDLINDGEDGVHPFITLEDIPASAVESVTGDLVDNTDPANPVINNPTLEGVLIEGNSTNGNNINLNGTDAIVLDNFSTLKKGTYDFGADGGISRICGVGYEDMWQSGFRHVFDSNGLIRNTTNGFDLIPNYSFDVTLRFKVGSFWTLDDGTTYICTDATEGAAVWELYNVIPTNTSDLTNDGEDGVNPFITAADVPSAVTSVGLTMPSAFSVTNSPITSSGDIAVTGAGLVSQYVRGDGTLANFPNSTGGGSSVNYYLNGSVSQGTFGGTTYYQMSKTPILGAGTNFIRTNGAGNGYIASFITDAGDPSFLNIPGGNWNVEFYFNASSGGGSPSFYAELYKVSATNVFTLIASDSLNPEGITNGTTVDQYYTSIPVPQTTLLVTDRLAVRIFVNTGGRTITLHTENGNLSEVLTTFTTGLTALNGLTDQVQYLNVGTTGTDFNISSVTDTHTFNLPDASATARGVITTGTQTIAGQKTFNPSVTAATAIAKGTVLTPTLIASANSDVLIGLDIAPTFTNGAFTGVSNYSLRVGGTITPNTNSTHNIGGGGSLRFANGFFSGTLYTSVLRGTQLVLGDEIGGNYMKIFTSGNIALQNSGTFTDLPSARLQVNSTTQGFLPPRMTTTQRNAIASPATGLIVYDTTLLNQFQYNGTAWVSSVSARRNANNSSNNNINYCGTAANGSTEASAVWTIKRLTITASGSITIATATNVAWTNRESATYI
jgi:hypothetical protein